MHVIFRESHGLEETAQPVDLQQTPADMVVLSFSDSDLGAFSVGWHNAKEDLPSLRLANLAALQHPLSVDTYIEQTLRDAKAVLVRLIGGMPYWSYGLQQLRAVAEENGIALAVLAADGRADSQLDDISTLPVSTLRRLRQLCDAGGPDAASAALAQLALSAGLFARPKIGQKNPPRVGGWSLQNRLSCPAAFALRVIPKPAVVISFYLSYLTAADLAPIEAAAQALEARGFDVFGVFVPSLKEPESAAWLQRQMRLIAPVAILNATAFSGKGPDGASPLDIAEVPVFQMALATSTRAAWADTERGLSPAELAMHVVLPEVDGRLFAGVGSFKDPAARDPQLQFSRFIHKADAPRIAAIADRIRAHVDLSRVENAQKRPVLVLSTYPGKPWQMAHAVGLDALASAEAILSDLQTREYDVVPDGPLHKDLQNQRIKWPLSAYKTALKDLPECLQTELFHAWGDPETDPQARNGALEFAATRRGKALIALQPERGSLQARETEYHDTSRTPRHSYVAFYLWLRTVEAASALIHIGAHGTLEWLPGKSVALSEVCWPEALIKDLPVIYPFIVNDPGEAAQAKRRICAITLGHIPPAMKASATPDRLVFLENLLDEFSNADGLDPRRRTRLQDDIRAEAKQLGVEQDLGLDAASSNAEAISCIDRFVCDIKESQFGDGLHIFGRAPEIAAEFDSHPSIKAESAALLTALNGKRVAAGPSGSPYRGRKDVLPTGRNLFTTDPRVVPTRSAYAQGLVLAEELMRRHLQDHGDYPKNLIVDLWGSATMRTAGEEFAMALALIGVKPKWDPGSERVSGIEITPIAELERPRIDVTLRVSGLFRDIFPTLSALFSQAVQSLRARSESPDWNPYVTKQELSRVFGPAPGDYGLAMGAFGDTYTDEAREAAGKAWLAASAYALNGPDSTYRPDAIKEQVAKADGFVHIQDLPETDLLLAADYAFHEAGFAAAQGVTGGSAALYHVDNTNPEAVRARSLSEEIARVVHARASNSDWVAGMRRHGYRGAAEIAATLDHMGSFAHLANVVGPHLFDMFFDATLGNSDISTFMEDANPEAFAALKKRFEALDKAGLWVTRRNSIRASLEAAQ